MNFLLKMLRNFWFCIGMAVCNLLFMAQNLTDGTGWAWSALGVVAWTYLAWRSTVPLRVGDTELTHEQMARVAAITKTFRIELEAILREAENNESNRGEDKETDTQQPKDD